MGSCHQLLRGDRYGSPGGRLRGDVARACTAVSAFWGLKRIGTADGERWPAGCRAQRRTTTQESDATREHTTSGGCEAASPCALWETAQPRSRNHARNVRCGRAIAYNLRAATLAKRAATLAKLKRESGSPECARYLRSMLRSVLSVAHCPRPRVPRAAACPSVARENRIISKVPALSVGVWLQGCNAHIGSTGRRVGSCVMAIAPS